MILISRLSLNSILAPLATATADYPFKYLAITVVVLLSVISQFAVVVRWQIEPIRLDRKHFLDGYATNSLRWFFEEHPLLEINFFVNEQSDLTRRAPVSKLQLRTDTIFIHERE